MNRYDIIKPYIVSNMKGIWIENLIGVSPQLNSFVLKFFLRRPPFSDRVNVNCFRPRTRTWKLAWLSGGLVVSNLWRRGRLGWRRTTRSFGVASAADVTKPSSAGLLPPRRLTVACKH